jgi:hypothetical protein
MGENIELKRAILAEEIKICRKMMEIGYYPYKIKFSIAGTFEIEGRQCCEQDEELIESSVRKLNELYQVCQEPPPTGHDQTREDC